jgi:hypothetical protein
MTTRGFADAFSLAVCRGLAPFFRSPHIKSTKMLAPEEHPMDKYKHLTITHHESLPFVTVVQLSRPEKRNAINSKVRSIDLHHKILE